MKGIINLAVISLIVLVVTSCRHPEIRNNIISTQILGSADDGDSENPRDTYTGPADLDAEDRLTKASSVQPKYNEVAGSAEAEPRDPNANTVVEDVAIAKSFNKVVSELRIRRNGVFTFDIALDVNNVQLRHDGTVTIQVAAAVLDNQGVSVPNGGITNITFEFKRNATGGTDVIIAGDTANPDNTQANGDYNKTLSGPSGGINLQQGNYRIELDLRITAKAPVQFGNDGQKHRASVESAKATISLR